MVPEEALLRPVRPFTAADVRSRDCPIAASAGVYAWYFAAPLPNVPTAGCCEVEGALLLYVGISPKAPPANGRAASRQTLRSRIRYHYRGNDENTCPQRHPNPHRPRRNQQHPPPNSPRKPLQGQR